MRFFVPLRPWQPGRETRIEMDACPDTVVNQCAINENCKKKRSERYFCRPFDVPLRCIVDLLTYDKSWE